MRRVKVVTAFLEYNGKILILRRSGKVRTMRQKWTGVSGYMEGDENTYECALKEIEEETGVKREEVELVRTGEVLEVPDEEHDTVWVVHPHLFKTLNTNVRLDWEHDRYKWIKPDNIVNYDAVPMLKETLTRVK
jgi:8-oxo-dGTP pyrophosphatase MutT (NUDIX family)